MKTVHCMLLALLWLAACGDVTEGARVEFWAAAAGPADATGGALSFTNALGYRVTLTRATLHIGALYLNQTVPTSGSQETGCILPGTYVAQVLGSLTVDALSPQAQPFPTHGQGVAIAAKAAELWLSGGDINRIDDDTVILDAAGIAQNAAGDYPFEARLTIGRNRLIPTMDPAYPGSNPICKQRIVSLIPVHLTPSAQGTLLLRVDPRMWFLGVDFSIVPVAADVPNLHRFSNQNDNAADLTLYNSGLRGRHGVYQFVFSPAASP